MRSLVRAFAALVASSVPAQAQIQFVPGHLYTVGGGGIHQFDPTLKLQGTLTIPGMENGTGGHFNAAGNLVFIARRFGAVHVLEMEEDGTIVREREIGGGTLLLGSYTDSDASGRTYVADDHGILELSPGWGSSQVLPYTYNRASGVVVGPDNWLYTTDQGDGRLVVFNEQRQLAYTRNVGSVPVGLDFSPLDPTEVYIPRFLSGELFRYALPNGPGSVVLSGVQFMSDLEFVSDGSYYLSVWQNTLQHRSASHQLLHSVTVPGSTDSVTVFIPAPGPLAVLLIAMGLAVVRRR